MAKVSTYKLSFTAASLRLSETVKVAKAANDSGIRREAQSRSRLETLGMPVAGSLAELVAA